MARISTPAVSQNMYRHFAVATLVVTLLVGVFASGENRQAMAQGVEDAQTAAERAEFKVHAYGTPHMETKLDARVYNSESDYRDTYSDYGDPMDRIASRVSGGGGGSADAVNRGGGRYVPASYLNHQISDEELAALTPAQRKALLAQMAARGPSLDQGERQRQINSLVSASQRRSGSEAGLE